MRARLYIYRQVVARPSPFLWSVGVPLTCHSNSPVRSMHLVHVGPSCLPFPLAIRLPMTGLLLRVIDISWVSLCAPFRPGKNSFVMMRKARFPQLRPINHSLEIRDTKMKGESGGSHCRPTAYNKNKNKWEYLVWIRHSNAG